MLSDKRLIIKDILVRLAANDPIMGEWLDNITLEEFEQIVTDGVLILLEHLKPNRE